MKSWLRLIMTLSFVILLGLLSSLGAASGDNEYAGQTYAEVARKVSNAGGNATIASIVGAGLSTDECIVTGSRKGSNLDSSGQSRGYQVLVHLNCGKQLAGPGQSGNSVASTDGREAKKIMNWIESWNKGSIGSCVASADTAKWCLGQCRKYGTCSDELQQALSSIS